MFLLLGIDDLMSEFNIERCPSLANKPKLFLVQACRGPAEDRFLCPTDKSQDMVDFTVSDSTLSRSICPQESDFLLAFSTVPGYVSYRRPNFGSFFMQVSKIVSMLKIKNMIVVYSIVNTIA